MSRPGAHDGAHEPEQRILRREDLHHARPTLYLEVAALLHVVGAQALPVRRWKVKVRECVGLPSSGTLASLGQHPPASRRVVHGHGGGGVPGAEDRRDEAPHAAPQLPVAGGVHLGRRRDERPVKALITLEDVLEEESPRPELGDSQVEQATHASRLRSL